MIKGAGIKRWKDKGGKSKRVTVPLSGQTQVGSEGKKKKTILRK